MVTNQELIAKFQTLKQIKPNQEWVSLAKTQILSSKMAPAPKATFASLVGAFYQPKLAYSLAVLLFAVAGVFAYNDMNMLAPKPEVIVKSNVQELKLTSQGLASAIVGKQKTDIAVAVKKVNDANLNLAKTIVENPGAAKTVALEVKNNQTYLDVFGGSDVRLSSDLLYKAIDQQMIEDLRKTTLTKDQQASLDKITDLYIEGKYSQVLEKILLIK